MAATSSDRMMGANRPQERRSIDGLDPTAWIRGVLHIGGFNEPSSPARPFDFMQHVARRRQAKLVVAPVAMASKRFVIGELICEHGGVEELQEIVVVRAK